MTFEQLIGFSDTQVGYQGTKVRLKCQDHKIISKENGKEYGIGDFEIISLTNLRERVKTIESGIGRNKYTHINPNKEDVKNFLTNHRYTNSLFQVASQFNLLEMVDYTRYTPEDGVGIYWNDPTQGPACCQATIGGTIFRNYFIEMENGEKGQTRSNQVNCLDELLSTLQKKKDFDWQFQNGYILINRENFQIINSILSSLSPHEFEELKGLLKVGVHWGLQVNDEIKPLKQFVSQIFCSAIPLGNYATHGVSIDDAEPLARLVQEATQEATIISSIINKQKTGCSKVILTKVGGGVFGNKHKWISDAINKALDKYPNFGLDVRQFHYSSKESCYHWK